MRAYASPEKSHLNIETAGSFVAVPDAFPNADDSIRNAIKLEFRTVYSAENIVESVSQPTGF